MYNQLWYLVTVAFSVPAHYIQYIQYIQYGVS